MVNKLRKMLKNEKGFTLVELLAVIVILGIIVAIAIPAIGNIIDSAQEDADDAEDQLIIDAARLYTIQGDGSLPVTTAELHAEGYLEGRAEDFPAGTVEYDTDVTATGDANQPMVFTRD